MLRVWLSASGKGLAPVCCPSFTFHIGRSRLAGVWKVMNLTTPAWTDGACRRSRSPDTFQFKPFRQGRQTGRILRGALYTGLPKGAGSSYLGRISRICSVAVFCLQRLSRCRNSRFSPSAGDAEKAAPTTAYVKPQKKNRGRTACALRRTATGAPSGRTHYRHSHGAHRVRLWLRALSQSPLAPEKRGSVCLHRPHNDIVFRSRR